MYVEHPPCPPAPYLFLFLFVLSQKGTAELSGTSIMSIAYVRCEDLNFYHMVYNEKEKASKSYLGHFLLSQNNQLY